MPTRWACPVSRHRATGLLSLVSIGLALAATPAAARPGTPCRSAQFAVDGAPIGVGPVTSRTIELGPLAGLGDACPLTAVRKRRATRDGVTRIRARWDACPGFAGPVRLRARIASDCTAVVGTVAAKGYRRTIEASRTDCGDGVFETPSPVMPYAPTDASLDTHPLPTWYDDAKFGIMIHWGIFAIPAWAETVIDPGEWLWRQAPRAARLRARVLHPHPVRRVVPEHDPDPGLTGAGPPRRHVRCGLPVRGFPAAIRGRRGGMVGRRVGRSLPGRRRPLRRAGHQAPRRLLALAHRRAAPDPSRVEHEPRRRRRAHRRRAQALHAHGALLLGRLRLVDPAGSGRRRRSTRSPSFRRRPSTAPTPTPTGAS